MINVKEAVASPKSALSRFISAPRKSPLRLWAWRIHFYTGIVLAAFLLVLGVSGSCIVFREELDRSFLRSPSASAPGAPMSLQDIVHSVEAAHPGNQVGSLRGLDRADRIIAIRMKGSGKDSGKDADLTAFWDRRAGEMTNGAPKASRFLSMLVDFHKNLAMGKEGRAVNGLVAIGFVWLILSGLIVWWPGLANWKRGFSLNMKLSWKRINYDLHNLAGIVSITFLTLMAGTAVGLAAKEIPGLLALGKVSAAGHEERWHGGGREHSHRHGGVTAERQPPTPDRTIDELVQLASLDTSLAGFRLSGLELRDKHGDGMELQYEGSPGAIIVRVDTASGKILSKTGPSRFGVDLDAHNAIQALHFGRWGGVASRVAWVLFGLAPGVLALTGLMMWWNRSLSKRILESGAKPR